MGEGKKVLSVQCLIAALSLGCIIVTGVICTVLAVTSGDKALTKTKDAMGEGIRKTDAQCVAALGRTRDSGGQAIDQSFESATSNIIARTKEMLRSVSVGSKSTIEKNLDYFTKLSASWFDVIQYDQSTPLAATNDYDYLYTHRARVWADCRNGRNPGLTAVTLVSKGAAWVNVFEEYTTVANHPDLEHHEYYFSSSRGGPNDWLQMGTALPGGGYNTTHDPVNDGRIDRGPFKGQYEHPDCRPNAISPLTGIPCNTSAMRGCRSNHGIKTEGLATSGVCYFNLLPPTSSFYQLGMTFYPPGQPRYTPVMQLGAFVGFSVITVWGNEQLGKLGFNFMGVDVGSLARFLKSIEVGGPGARSRLALFCAKPSWVYNVIPLSTFDHEGMMVAVTHNNASSWYTPCNQTLGEDCGWEQSPRKIEEAGDPLIRAAARHIQSLNGSFASVAGDVISFNMNNTLAAGGHLEWLPGAKGGSRFWGPFESRIQYINGRHDPGTEWMDPVPGYARPCVQNCQNCAANPLACEGEEFFAAVEYVTSYPSYREVIGHDDGHTGQLELFLMVLIDREYVLGETDRLQAQTRADIAETNRQITEEVEAGRARTQEELRQSDKEVSDSLDQDRYILYGVVAGCALLLMALSLVMAKQIVKPIERLEEDMAAVALMKLEGVEEQEESALSEVALMQVSFVQMIKNLKEFRSYMPASVLLDEDSDEEAEASESQSVTQSQKESKVCTSTEKSGASEMSGGMSPRGRRQSSRGRDSKASSRASRASTAQQSAKLKAKNPSALATGVNKKAAAFLICNVREFCDVFKMGEAMECHMKYLSALLECAKKNKGLPDGFDADRFYCSFNGAKPAAGARAAAGRCALAMTEAANEIFKIFHKDGSQIGKVTCGVGGGDVMCGNMGIDGMKKYNMIGAARSFLPTLESHNAKMVTSILCDTKVKNDIEQSHRIRQMLPIAYKGGTQRTYEILEAMSASEDEWMYQLEEAAAADPGKMFSVAMEKYIGGDVAGAIEDFKSDQNQTPQHLIVLEHIGKNAS